MGEYFFVKDFLLFEYGSKNDPLFIKFFGWVAEKCSGDRKLEINKMRMERKRQLWEHIKKGNADSWSKLKFVFKTLSSS